MRHALIARMDLPGLDAIIAGRSGTASAPRPRRPGFDTILKVVGALGLSLHAEAWHS